jgi:hypothetical protein
MVAIEALQRPLCFFLQPSPWAQGEDDGIVTKRYKLG